MHNKNKLIAVTGANGFIGSSLCNELEQRGYYVRRLVRSPTNSFENEYVVGEIDGDTDWGVSLDHVATLVHCAARAHCLSPQDFSHNVYMKVNTLGTLRLARQAAAKGVKRFIFLSSIKVNGDRTSWNNLFGGLKKNHPFSHLDTPNPQDAYGISKWEAEQGLRLISLQTGMEVVIVRPPLVYGPGVSANFMRLIKLVSLGIPLPFRLIENKRSFIGLFNLVDFIICCITNNSAVGHTFLVSDGQDVSTPELLIKISEALINVKKNKRSRLILLPVPEWPLRLIFYLFAQHSLSYRLIDSLQVDITHARVKLGWYPPKSMDEYLLEAVRSISLKS
jgi:nucleoside-diphosphate-sugar epimerase